MVESSAYDLDLIFHALSDPTRRAILKTLTRHERAIGAIAKRFKMSLAAVSKHGRVLERARLVQRTRRGSFSYLSLNGKAMRTAGHWIGHYLVIWEERLANLAQLLEKHEGGWQSTFDSLAQFIASAAGAARRSTTFRPRAVARPFACAPRG